MDSDKDPRRSPGDPNTASMLLLKNDSVPSAIPYPT